MAQFEIIFANKQTGVEERCTQAEWERIKAHKTMGRAFHVVGKEQIPQAAVEAQEAKKEEAQSASITPTTRKRKAKSEEE